MRNFLKFALVCLCFALPVHSAPQKADHITYVLSSTSGVLKGVKNIRVIIGDFQNIVKDQLEKDGLRHEDIQADIELAIRQSGIKIVEAGDSGYANAPLFNVSSAILFHDKMQIYVYLITLELDEPVIPIRNPKLVVQNAATWKQEVYGMVGAGRVSDIRGPIKDTANQFVNDYLKANPKR